MSRLVSLHQISRTFGKDPRKVADALYRKGIEPDATLYTENKTQPLYEMDRVEAIKQALLESWRKHSKPTNE